MLRALIVVLALANLGYYAWSQGWLAMLLGRPGQGEREPERMARQVRPEMVTVLRGNDARSAMADAAQRARTVAAEAASAASASDAAAAAATALPADALPAAGAVPACLETGPLVQAEWDAAARALRALPLPPTRWTTQRGERGGQFMVTMGRYTDRAALQKKQAELRQLGVKFTDVTDAPPLMPGLDLGRFDDRNAASQALNQLAQRGVRSARVAILVAPTPVVTLRIDKPDAALAARLDTLGPGAGEARFRPCAAPAAGPAR
jgi:hypothetical protein